MKFLFSCSQLASSAMALSLLLLLAGCAKEAPGTAAAGANTVVATLTDATAAPEAIPVEVELARVGPIASFLGFNSTIEVETAIEVFPEVAGLVKEILVEEGDRVKAGQPLLRLDHDEQLVELKESQVNLEHLESSFRRTDELHAGGLINQQDYDTRKFELEQARLRLERAQLRIKQATVLAPVDGVITERAVQPGARVGSGAKLFGMMSLDDMIARVHVPGIYLTSIKEGQEAALTSDWMPGKTFAGSVKRISPIVDPASGTFKVTVGVRAGDNPPPPGLFVYVRIVTDRRQNAVLVPKRAIIYEGSERYVFAVRDDKATKVRLEVGYEEGEVVESLSNIAPGTPLVVLGQNALRDQALVRAVNIPTSATAAQTPAAAAAESAVGATHPAGT